MRADRGERWAWAEIDLDAVEHNVTVLRLAAAPAAVWAVVKADGYGHGAIDVATAALRAGAAGLCVALVREGEALRHAGIDAPILVLSEQPHDQVDSMLAHKLTPTVYTNDGVLAIGERAAADVEVHVYVDTGMQRVGVAAPDAAAFITSIPGLAPRVHVGGVYSHLACADEPNLDANRYQLDRFDEVLAVLDAAGSRPPLVHVGNSAAALAIPPARHSFVRAGIAVYGISPGSGVDGLCQDLRPVLSLRARVSHVKRVASGSSISYGWRHRFERDTTVITLPLGYADGVPRRLGTLPDRIGADVLIRGRRYPIVGVVTMDQFMVDVGDDEVAVGDDAVLIGSQGQERIRAEDWASRLGTIGYEIVCGISARIPRLVRGAALPS